MQNNIAKNTRSSSKETGIRPNVNSVNGIDSSSLTNQSKNRTGIDSRSVDSRELKYLRRLDSEDSRKTSEYSLREEPLRPLEFNNNENQEIIVGQAANTDEGIVRNYNEDRVTIILNIVKPSSRDPKEVWPKCSQFGVYDGHGGSLCADYLRDNLHQ